MLLKSNKETN